MLLDIIRSRVRCSLSNAAACKRNRCRTHDKGGRTTATHYAATDSMGPSTSSRPRNRQRRPAASTPRPVLMTKPPHAGLNGNSRAKLTPRFKPWTKQSATYRPQCQPQCKSLNTVASSQHTLALLRSDLPCPAEQSQLQPLPVATHVVKPYLSQPMELSLQADQLVGWILVRFRDAECLQKLPMELV